MIRHPARRLCLLATLLLSAACARSPVTHYYVLDAPATVTTPGERHGPRLGLGPVTLPAYLDRPQILVRTSANRLELATSQRWAEPFADAFRRALASRLAAALPDTRLVNWPWKPNVAPSRQLVVEVERCDRAETGAVLLIARWQLTGSGVNGDPSQHVSRIEVPVGGKPGDYDALVAAHAEAIARLAAEMAPALTALPQ